MPSACGWLISLSRISSRFVHVIAYISISFLFKAKHYFLECTDHVLFICLLADGHLGSFHLLATVNDAVLNMAIQISLAGPAFVSSG